MAVLRHCSQILAYVIYEQFTRIVKLNALIPRFFSLFFSFIPVVK